MPPLNPSLNFAHSWKNGRLFGVEGLEIVSRRMKSKPYTRNVDGHGGVDSKYAPLVPYRSASEHFSGPFASSVGADAVDAMSSAASNPDGPNESNVLITAEHFLSHSDVSPIYVGSYVRPFLKNLTDLPPTKCRPSRPSSGHEYESVSLICAEVLRYEEPLCRGISGCRDTPPTDSFLVVHPVAENCSNRTIEDVSASDNHPRNEV